MIGQADGREARAINNLRNHVTQNVYGDGIGTLQPKPIPTLHSLPPPTNH